MSTTLQRAREQRWYHTMELAPGFVTPGWFDMRPYVGHYGLPERMDGMRVLDAGTWDGFWAFEMERRGADVVALDIDQESECDWPPRTRPSPPSPEFRGVGFELAHELLGSSVRRVHCNIYNASVERLGTFDLVLVSAVIMHLRDQLLGLERLADVCAGRFLMAEEYDPLSGLSPFPVSRFQADRERAPVFWLPSRRTWRRMLWTAGVDDVHEHARYRLRMSRRMRLPFVVLHGRGRATPVPAPSL